MRTLSAGPGGVMQPNAVHDVDEAHGRDLIDRGYAVPHTEAAPIEQATAPAGETAEDPANRRRGSGQVFPHVRKR